MSGDTIDYALCQNGPRFSLNRTSLHITLPPERRARALAHLPWPFRKMRVIQDVALMRIEGPHLLSRLSVCIAADHLRIRLPHDRSIHWQIPVAGRASAERFVAHVSEHTLARKRHQTESRSHTTSTRGLLATAGFLLAFKWLARAVKRFS